MGHCHAFDLFYQISITPYSGFFHQYVSKIQSGGSVRRRPPSLVFGRESLLRRNGTNGLLRVRRTCAGARWPGSFLLFGTPKKRPRVFPGMSVAKNAEPPASSCVTACSSFPDDFRSGARPGRAPRRDARRRIAPGTCQPGKSAAPQKGPRARSRGRGVQESARQTGRTYFQKRWQSW